MKVKPEQNSLEEYEYLRPNLSRLLRLLKIDKQYTCGEGNLITDSNGNNYLDMTGSYGANLLGHGNILRKEAANYLLENSLSFTQGSIRKEASLLSQLVSTTLNNEYKTQCDWITMQGNSGAEAVEIALKAALLNHEEEIQKLLMSVNESFNKVLLEVKENSYDYNLLKAKHAIAINLLNKEAILLSLERAFHGKTQNALKVTANENFKSYIKTSSNNQIRPNSIKSLNDTFKKNLISIDIPTLRDNNIQWSSIQFSKVAALIIEPIQGEGGIHKIEDEFLLESRLLCDLNKSLLIFDEIQTGGYRTGLLSHGAKSQVIPDCLTFGKVISAGFAKISLTSFKRDSFPSDLDLIHSSTYSEDDLSSYIARRSIELASKMYEFNINNIDHLNKELQKFINESQNFETLRGEGLLLGLQLNEDLIYKNYEFKFFHDASILGHIFSSAFLNNEGMRLSPTLSNQLTIRVQPSLGITKQEVEKLICALKNFDKAISTNDSAYFFKHLFPEYKIGPFNSIKKEISHDLKKDLINPTFFLSHVIETKGAKDILTVFKDMPDDEVEEISHQLFQTLDFNPYFVKNITGDNKKQSDIVMMSLPISSKLIYKIFRSDQRHLLVSKMQKAIDKCKELGGSTVGLGQFTSITSKNGLYLNASGINLTTGNSYTAKLAYDAGKKETKDQSPTIAFVGFGGNIVTTLVNLALHDAKKIILIHRAKDNHSPKIVKLVEDIITYAIKSKDDSPLIEAIKERAWENIGNIRESLERFNDLIEITNDIKKVSECELIYTGTNSTKTLLNDSIVTKGSVCVDLAVPGDYCLENRIANKDILVIKGGIAKFPQNYNKEINIEIPSFPLGENESFACMAETFSLGLSGEKNKLKIGPIRIEDIKEISTVAGNAGFKLNSYKKENSF